MTRNRMSSQTIAGWAFIGGVLLLTAVVFSGIYRAPFQKASTTVVADFDHAGQLYKGDQVRVNGNIEGKVKSIKPSPNHEAARVTLAVDKNAGPIYADARARLRVKTLLGGAFYVDLERGTPGTGDLGSRVITTDRTSVQTEIEDVTDAFRGGAVTGLTTLPGSLATGLSDTTPPVQTLKSLNAVARSAAVGLDAARGQKPGVDLPALVTTSAKAVAALDTLPDDVRTVVSGAAVTLRTTAARSAEIRQTLAAGPGVTYDLNHTLARLDGTLDVADGLIHRLHNGVPQIAPTLGDVRPTLSLAAGTLQNAKPVLRRAPETLNALAQAGPQLEPLLTDLRPSLRRTAATILPYLARKDPITGYSTSVMIGGFGSGFGGIGTQMDQNGHFVRFPAGVGPSSAYLPCSSSLIDPGVPSQLACDSFNTAVKTYLNYLPNPSGGTAPKGGKKR